MKTCTPRRRPYPRLPGGAFTLIEVMIATMVLALLLFGVLSICASGLRTARTLQKTHVDASSLAAWLSMTNRLEEGVDSGDFRQFLGEAAPDAAWTSEVREVQTNGLFRVDYVVTYQVGGKPVEAPMSILLFRPASNQRRPGR